MMLIYTPNAASGMNEPFEILADRPPYQLVRGSLQGFGGVNAVHMTHQSPNQNGSRYFFSRYDARMLSFDFLIFADDWDDMQDRKQHIAKVFSAAYGAGTLRLYTNLSNTKCYDISAVPDGNPSMFSTIKNLSDLVCKCTVDLTAYSPFWRDPVTKSTQFTTYGGFQLPFAYDFSLGTIGGGNVVNQGQVQTPAKIILHGPFTNPVLTNERTGESIKVIASIDEGERLVIDTNPETSSVTRIDAHGFETSMFNAVSTDSSFWQIQPGGNMISYSDSESWGELPIEIEWNDCFVGVF